MKVIVFWISLEDKFYLTEWPVNVIFLLQSLSNLAALRIVFKLAFISRALIALWYDNIVKYTEAMEMPLEFIFKGELRRENLDKIIDILGRQS